MLAWALPYVSTLATILTRLSIPMRICRSISHVRWLGPSTGHILASFFIATEVVRDISAASDPVQLTLITSNAARGEPLLE